MAMEEPPGTDNDDALIARALATLEAIIFRTGAAAKDADLNRAVQRYGLNAKQAALLAIRARDDGTLAADQAPLPEMPISASGGEDIDILSLWMRDIKQYELLSHADEVALARAVRAGGEAKAELNRSEPLEEEVRDRLEHMVEEGQRAFDLFVASNLRLVTKVAMRERNKGLEYADLIQAGTFGLMIAVRRFDPSMGFKFSTYATHWIWQSITRTVVNEGRLIRLPAHIHEEIARVKKYLREAEREGRPVPDVFEIGRDTGVEPAKVAALIQLMEPSVSLDMEVMDESISTIGDFVKQKESDVLDTVMDNALHDSLLKEMNCLSEREKDVVMRRFGINAIRSFTLEEIGDSLGITRERVRQIEAKALTKMRNRMKYAEYEDWMDE